MAVNAFNAFVANPPIDGGVYFNAPVGTKLPKTATEALDSAFVDHGAVGEDGFNVNPKRETSTEKMFGGEDWADIQTSYTEEVTLTLLEDFNNDVMKTLFGADNVEAVAATSTTSAHTTIYHTSKRLPIMSHVLKAVDGDKDKTFVIPRGRITAVEKTPDVHSASTKYNVTITCFKGPKEAKYAYAYELRDHGIVAALSDDVDDFGDSEDPAKTVTLPAGVTGGMWALSIDGKKSAEVEHNATARVVQVALRNVAGGKKAQVTGEAGGPYTIAGVKGEITADGTGLEGAEDKTITVS